MSFNKGLAFGLVFTNAFAMVVHAIPPGHYCIFGFGAFAILAHAAFVVAAGLYLSR